VRNQVVTVGFIIFVWLAVTGLAIHYPGWTVLLIAVSLAGYFIYNRREAISQWLKGRNA
jgi:hypothetical protein